MRVGVVSDTHGVLPDAVLEAFAGVSRILHAGDVGSPRVLELLETVAPVIAVKGNMDDPASPLPALANLELDGVRVLVTHRAGDVPRPLPPGVRVVVTGHTHVPRLEDREGVLWLNPGSVSQPLSGSGRTVALLEVTRGEASAEIVPLS